MNIPNDFIEQVVNPFVTDKLEKLYKNDKEYQRRKKDEDLIYQKLTDSLSEKQLQQLENYFTASSSASARKEALTYIQGMKDLLELLRYLSK